MWPGDAPSSLLSQHLGSVLQLGVGGAERSLASPLLSPPPRALEPAAGSATRLPFVPRAPAIKMPAAPVPAIVSGQVLPAFLLCSTLLVIKMYVVAVITGQVRLRKKVRAALRDPSPGLSLPRWFQGPSVSVRGVCGQGWGPGACPGMAPLWPCVSAGSAPSCPLFEEICSLAVPSGKFWARRDSMSAAELLRLGSRGGARQSNCSSDLAASQHRRSDIWVEWEPAKQDPGALSGNSQLAGQVTHKASGGCRQLSAAREECPPPVGVPEPNSSNALSSEPGGAGRGHPHTGQQE